MPLQKFTLIGATTRAGLLTSPLRARFGIVHRLDFYTDADIEEIVRRSARILDVPIDDDAARGDRAAVARHAAHREPAAAARARLRAGARRRHDHADVARAALKLLEVDEHGFDEVDRKLLRTIIDKFGGGPVGVNSIAAAISEEKDAIEDIYEPFLIQIGFLDRTPRGRVATPRAYEYFGLTAPGKGLPTVVTRPSSARAGRAARASSSLATYVPPRLLTNADLEKMVETTDEWILQRTGIRERHIVDPGRRDVRPRAHEAALEAIERAGLTPDRHRLHRRRHDDARHDVSEHGVPACRRRSARRTRGDSTSAPRARASPTP